MDVVLNAVESLKKSELELTSAESSFTTDEENSEIKKGVFHQRKYTGPETTPRRRKRQKQMLKARRYRRAIQLAKLAREMQQDIDKPHGCKLKVMIVTQEIETRGTQHIYGSPDWVHNFKNNQMITTYTGEDTPNILSQDVDIGIDPHNLPQVPETPPRLSLRERQLESLNSSILSQGSSSLWILCEAEKKVNSCFVPIPFKFLCAWVFDTE